MEKKMLLIYNPVSGKAQIKTYLAEIITVFTLKGYQVTVHPTSKAKDGYDYILSNAEYFDVISVCGGDGMLNEALNALMLIDESKRPPVAFLPSGSTNDFASTVGIPLDIRNAAKMVVDGKPFFCDAGKFNDNYFAYVAAFGAFTSVAYDTAQEFKNVFGHLAYILEGIRQLPTIKAHHMKITFDTNVIEGDFILGMVTNSLQIGGMKNTIGTAISLNDGLFEVLLIKKPPNALALQSMLTELVAPNLSINNDEIIKFKASEILFESENEIPWTLDGEFGGNVNSATIKNIHRAFAVMV